MKDDLNRGVRVHTHLDRWLQHPQEVSLGQVSTARAPPPPDRPRHGSHNITDEVSATDQAQCLELGMQREHDRPTPALKDLTSGQGVPEIYPPSLLLCFEHHPSDSGEVASQLFLWGLILSICHSCEAVDLKLDQMPGDGITRKNKEFWEGEKRGQQAGARGRAEEKAVSSSCRGLEERIMRSDGDRVETKDRAGGAACPLSADHLLQAARGSKQSHRPTTPAKLASGQR